MTKKQKRREDAGSPTGPKGAAKIPGSAPEASPTASIIPKPQPNMIRADDLASTPIPAQLLAQPTSKSQYKVAPAVNLKFKDIIRVINKMQEEGVISRYAVGGAVGAAFYVEVVRTADVDIFVPIHQEPGRIIVTLDPFKNYLEARGYQMKDEYWEIEGTIVQFMPIEQDPLLMEAVSQPREFDVEGVRTFVFSPEHLVAVALKVCRPDKDVHRIQQFVREKAIDLNRFLDILKRHQLTDAWGRFRKKYLESET